MLYKKNLRFALAFSTSFLVFALWTAQISPAVNAEVQMSQSNSEIVQAAQGKSRNLRVTRVISSGDYALVDWLQGDGGGQAALIKKNEKWIVVSSGGGQMNQQYLIELGFPPDVAQGLFEKHSQSPNKTLK